MPFRFRPHGDPLVAADTEDLDRAHAHGHALSASGFPARAVSTDELRDLEPGLAPDLAGAVIVEGAYALHPVLAAAALAGRAARAGAEIRTHAPVRGLTTAGDRVTGVVTDDGPLAAGNVVLAAGPWSRAWPSRPAAMCRCSGHVAGCCAHRAGHGARCSATL
ncbi:FAD-dependent oxidoreductase [Streptomyces canarius]